MNGQFSPFYSVFLLLFFVTALGVMLTIHVFDTLAPTSATETRVVMLQNNQSSHETVSCMFPQLDPWDKTLEPYIEHPRQFQCSHMQHDDVVYLDEWGHLVLNETAHSLTEKLANQTVRCFYSFLDKAPGSEKTILNHNVPNTRTSYKQMIPKKRIAPLTDLVEVVCSAQNESDVENWQDTAVYYDFFPLPSNQTVENKTFLPTTENQLSVLMFVLESVSLSVLRRNLPKTYAYLTNQMQAFVFQGYTKVSDNSFHNLIPILTGKRTRTEQAGMEKEFDEDVNSIQFDDWDLIWKHYAAKGYVTAFEEDHPEMGLFHSPAKGFSNKPTHHYYRPFWREMRESKLQWKSSSFCFGNKPRLTYHMDIVRRHVKKYNKIRQFMYAFFTDLSHDTPNNIERADEHFYEFFDEMFRGGFLNHTVLMLFSDHGNRMSNILRTPIGLIEERMAAYTLTFPAWFLKKHPKVAENLRKNQKKLSSNFDVHATLFDILNANYYGEQGANSSRAMSHLYSIPANRTCAEAGIPDFYCVCQKVTPLDISLPLVYGAAQAVVAHLNFLLNNYTDQCTDLTFKVITHAVALSTNNPIRESRSHLDEPQNLESSQVTNVDQVKMLRIGIEVMPSEARLEALVTIKNATATLYSVSDNISRTNRYGNQSACLQTSNSERVQEMKKYCFCKQLTTL